MLLSAIFMLCLLKADAACPSSCPTSWLGDGECDSVCNSADCSFDNGDCVAPDCATGCTSSMEGDGTCDTECNVVACTYDSGDCDCATGCGPAIQGDGSCDTACNVAACSYDSGDCECAAGCSDAMKGDGTCDSACNNSDCSCDDGDCGIADGCQVDNCVDDSNNPNCVECTVSSAGTCTDCNIGYELSASGTCATDDCSDDANYPNCLTCDSGPCTLCNDGYHLSEGGTCESELCDDDSNNPDCLACTVGTADTCTVCNNGTFLSEDGTCESDACNDDPNNPNCLSCTVTSPGTCTLCNSGWNLASDGTCATDDCEDDAYNPNCLDCTEGTANTCTVCQDGTLMSSVQSCVEDTCTDITDCLTCDDTSVCTVCDSTTELAEDNTCIADTCTAADEDPNCLTCDTPGTCTLCAFYYELDGIVCSRAGCPDGQYLNDVTCHDCKNLCIDCTNTSDCTSCDMYTYMIDSTCYCVQYSEYNSVTDSCVCDTDYTGDSDGIACVPLGDYLPSSAYTSVAFTSNKCEEFEVRFNTAVTVVDAEETDCESLFEPTTVHILGNDPTCTWSDDKRTLTVELSDHYDFTAATVNIEVNWRHVRNSADENDRNYSQLSRTISKSSCPTPVTSISAPSKYSSACTDSPLELQAFTSAGVGNSPITYSWSVTPALTDLSSIDDSEVSITVPAETSGDYTFTVTATNTFGKTDTDTTIVEILDTESLTLTFDTSPRVTIKGGQSIKVKPLVTADCNASGTPRYDWAYERTVSGAEVTAPTGFETSDSKLKLGKNDLKAGEGYVFSCTATQSGFESYEELTITVEYSELIVRLNLGDQDISSGVDLEIDGSDSEDPDGEELYYVWTCQHAGTGSVCLNSEGSFLITETTPLTTAQVLEVASEDLTPDDVLEFTLTISTLDGRESSKTVTLTVKDAGDASIEVVPIEIEKLLVHRGLIITLYVRGVQIAWDQVDGPTLNPSSGTNLPSIRFAPYSMTQGADYTFRATLSTSGTAQIALEISWSTNMGPVCFGSLSSTLDTGNFYSLNIPDCFDADEEDYPLTYSFGTEFRGRPVPLSSPASFDYMIFYFIPAAYTVTARVCDSAGSCITYDLSVSLGRRRLESDTQSLQEEFSEAHTDDDQIPMLVKMFAESYNHTEEDWDFLYTKLEGFAASVLSEEGEYSIDVATGMMAAVLELLEKAAAASSNDDVTRGLAFIDDVTENIAEQFDEDFFELVAGVLGSLENTQRVFTSLLATEGNLNRLMIADKLPGESVTFLASDDTVFTGLYRDTGSNSVTFTTTDGTYQVEFADLTSSSTDIIDMEVMVIPPTDDTSSPIIDLLFSRSGTYDSVSLELSLSDNATPIDTSILTTPLNITMPFATVQNTTYKVYTLNEDGKWERDDRITLTIVDSDTLTISTPHASSFQVAELSESESDSECDMNPVPFYIMGCWIAVCTAIIILSYILGSRGSKHLSEVQQMSKDVQGEGAEGEKDVQSKTVFNEPPANPAPSPNFLSCHLVTGVYWISSLSRVIRIAELMLDVLLNLTFVGVLLLAFATPTDDTSDDLSDIGEYIGAAVIGAVIAWFFTLLIELLFVKSSQLQILYIVSWVLIALGCIGSIFGISFMTIDFCSNWTSIWAILFIIAVAIDLILLQSLTALVKLCIPKIFK